MTKFIIEGVKYDMSQALFHPPIGAVNELRQEFGIVPSSIEKQFRSLSAAKDNPDFDADEFMYSEDFQKAFFGLIFLGKRRAGEKVTLQEVKDQVAELSYSDIGFESDEVVPDPKVPTNSGQVDESAATSSQTGTPS